MVNKTSYATGWESKCVRERKRVVLVSRDADLIKGREGSKDGK